MSLLPPGSVPTSISLQPRDASPLAIPATQRAAPAVGASLTQAAVQQARASQRAEMLTTRDSVFLTDKRDRLIGPPPAFDINVLQHLREIRSDPTDAAPTQADPLTSGAGNANDTATTDDSAAGDDSKSPISAAYGQLPGADPPESYGAKVDTRL